MSNSQTDGGSESTVESFGKAWDCPDCDATCLHPRSVHTCEQGDIRKERDHLRDEVAQLKARYADPTWVEVNRRSEERAIERDQLRAALEAAQGEIKRLTAWTDEDAEEWQKPMSYTAARAENKRLQSTVDRLTREKEALEGQLAVAERLIEVVRAREIGTAGGVGAAFAAYDALEGN